MVLLKQPDEKITILKHLSFPEKIKVQMLKKLVYGSPFKLQFMPYCLENLGGCAFTCFDLRSQGIIEAQRRNFEQKDHEEIDQGFDHILRKAQRSTCEMAQFKWQTKELRNKDSPIFGWPCALVSQALRSVVSENAIARKGAHALACSFDSRVLRHFCPQSS